MSEKKTPILIALIGVLFFITGIICFVVGILGLVLPEFEDIIADILPDFDIGALQTSAIVNTIVGFISMIVGWGFLKGWSVFWYLGVIVSVLALIMEAYNVYLGAYPTIGLIIVNLFILLYLFSPKVKTYFLE